VVFFPPFNPYAGKEGTDTVAALDTRDPDVNLMTLMLAQLIN